MVHFEANNDCTFVKIDVYKNCHEQATYFYTNKYLYVLIVLFKYLWPSQIHRHRRNFHHHPK